MLASAHLAVGAAGGRIFYQNHQRDSNKMFVVALSCATGILSHVILDAIPHAEYGDYINFWPWPILIVESCSIFVMVLPRAGWTSRAIMFSGMVGAALPDMLVKVPGDAIRDVWLILHHFHGELPMGFDVPILGQVFLAIAVSYLVGKKTA